VPVLSTLRLTGHRDRGAGRHRRPGGARQRRRAAGAPLSSREGDRPDITLGVGSVIRTEDDAIVVLFEESGYRTLSLTTVTERDLLQQASPD